MQLAQQVKTFSSACEHILSASAVERPLTPEEAALIEYYCVEVLNKIAPILGKSPYPQTMNHNGSFNPVSSP